MKFSAIKKLWFKIIPGTIVILFATTVKAQHMSPWNAPESAKNQKNPFAPDKSSLTRGKNSYTIECARCHGALGKGDGPAAIKVGMVITDLSTDAVQNQSDGELFWKISEGRRPMPYKKIALTDDQRWDVINYVRSLKHL